MKRILFLIVALVMVSSVCTAQVVKVDSGNTSLEMTLKRCLAQGNQVIMDFVVTCHTNTNRIYYNDPDIYDDEGNLYHGSIPSSINHYNNYVIDGNDRGCCGELRLEKDIPRKLRLIVRNMDEYASSLLLVKIPYILNSTTYTATIKNLPINRE